MKLLLPQWLRSSLWPAYAQPESEQGFTNALGDEHGLFVRPVPPQLLAGGELLVQHEDVSDQRSAYVIQAWARMVRFTISNDGAGLTGTDAALKIYFDDFLTVDGEGAISGTGPAIVLRPGETYDAEMTAQTIYVRCDNPDGTNIRYAAFGYGPLRSERFE